MLYSLEPLPRVVYTALGGHGEWERYIELFLEASQYAGYMQHAIPFRSSFQKNGITTETAVHLWTTHQIPDLAFQIGHALAGVEFDVRND